MSYQPKEGDLVKLKKDFEYSKSWLGKSNVIPAGTFGEIFKRGVLAGDGSRAPKTTYNIIFYKCQPLETRKSTWPIDEHTRRDQTDPVVMSANLLKVPNFSWDPPPDAAQETYHGEATKRGPLTKPAVIVPVTSKSGGRKRKTKRKSRKRHRRKTRKRRKRRVKKRRQTRRR